ncbi:MAG: aminopeptidase [Actinomycetota bacterium]|nr:aminopeptidase [Actinomycetota bacterium]
MTHLERLAELAVVVGANVQPGQVVQVTAEVEQIEVLRAVTDAAYRHGARFVDAQLRAPVLQRSLVINRPAQAYVPTWADASTYGLDAAAGARIMLIGPSTPGLLDDLDPVLVDRAQPPRSRAWREVEYRVNNTIIPGPHQAWAQSRYPQLTAGQALENLWQDIAIACRLDDEDPVANWRRRFADLSDRAHQLSAMGLDAIRLGGPGTDLLVGLLPGVQWAGPTNISERGVLHAWNLPSEEIYTSPDPARVNGHVRLTRPAVVGGTIVNDVTLRFVNGDVSEIAGGGGVDGLRAFASRDAGTRRVGALVDADSAVAHVDRPFGLGLLDENTAAHLALGFGFPQLANKQTRARVNQSGDHLDLTIGSPDLQITGLDCFGGSERALMRDGRWALL